MVNGNLTGNETTSPKISSNLGHEFEFAEELRSLRQRVVSTEILSSIQLVFVITLLITIIVICLLVYKRIAYIKRFDKAVKRADLFGHQLTRDMNHTFDDFTDRGVRTGKRNHKKTRRISETFGKSFVSQRSGDTLQSIAEHLEEDFDKSKTPKDEDMDCESDRRSDCSQMSDVIIKMDRIIDRTFDSIIAEVSSMTSDSLKYNYS